MAAENLTLAFFGINEVALEIEDPFGEDENDLPLDPMGDALKADCEMNLEIAAIPPNNMKLYWEEISKSKQRYKKLEKDRMEQDVKKGIQTQTAQTFAAQSTPQLMIGAGSTGSVGGSVGGTPSTPSAAVSYRP